METEVLGSVTHAIRAQNVRAVGEREKRACECSVLSHAREDYAVSEEQVGEPLAHAPQT